MVSGSSGMRKATTISCIPPCSWQSPSRSMCTMYISCIDYVTETSFLCSEISDGVCIMIESIIIHMNTITDFRFNFFSIAVLLVLKCTASGVFHVGSNSENWKMCCGWTACHSRTSIFLTLIQRASYYALWTLHFNFRFTMVINFTPQNYGHNDDIFGTNIVRSFDELNLWKVHLPRTLHLGFYPPSPLLSSRCCQIYFHIIFYNRNNVYIQNMTLFLGKHIFSRENNKPMHFLQARVSNSNGAVRSYLRQMANKGTAKIQSP